MNLVMFFLGTVIKEKKQSLFADFVTQDIVFWVVSLNGDNKLVQNLSY
jgi:hypothetical protein